MSVWQPSCAQPTPHEHSPVTYFVLMDQRPCKAWCPCSCWGRGRLWAESQPAGLPSLITALSHEREFTPWLPSQPPPSLFSGGGNVGQGEPGLSPPLLLSQLPHNLGFPVSPGQPEISEIFYQSLGHLQHPVTTHI